MKEIPATSEAYGSCVETCERWSQAAPADDIMVVSEIGDTWSPYTAPAIHAAIIGIIISGRDSVIASPIGISIPNVPHEVPAAKDSRQAIKNRTAGINAIASPPKLVTIFLTKSASPRLSVIALRDQAKVRISIGEIICFRPSGTQFIQSLNVTILLSM